MPTLNIIGAGKLGKTLARLWQQQGFFQIRSLCNRSAESTRAAAQFIGAGTACGSIASMADADCWLIACGDGQIGEVAAQLAPRISAHPDTIVFHCSGALSSEVLSVCGPAAIASAHPVHSFADPQLSVQTLAGSSVAVEGDQAAVALLQRAFSALDCNILTIEPEHKTLYHAGSVFACNYLTALMDLSLRTFAAAGIEEQQALQLLKPIVLQTAANNMQLGPEKSLTGPIARGDVDTVRAQLNALQNTDAQLAQCYRQLGLACVELARRGALPDAAAAQLTELLSEPTR
ncbi:Predicted oxidoreductase, contains short-chain dehydrogenase (SDR) and DUF2520 domains [Microbulbifer donghaiensis]|uniref:Predicted oxidoreductase, contains short-chain dehydrogenase (SDR) and DUF2520 domains n=1 Tax=Microbulbifer donghaiensis TaxID=494016 RepID=A0A1M4WYL8_9GAMM|nr:Rossmann-like and DUF2520 domain-containing protein [Microbulbifer donghaiensis]SHE86237.1 Predicted oxidoreductase, contains short-chain dehydrogenase (SDR) and DUF2520 domains [Microbulbifer donghaiensis]